MFSSVLTVLAIFALMLWSGGIVVGTRFYEKRTAPKPLPPAPPPKPMDPETAKLLGFVTEGDRLFTVPMRNWEAVKLALWRSKVGWEIVQRAAQGLVDGCKHAPDCAGKTEETEVCKPSCPDREVRLSALVILNSARQFAPVDVRRPANAPYFAPSRERFSEVLAELVTTQDELLVLRGATVTAPPVVLEELLAAHAELKALRCARRAQGAAQEDRPQPATDELAQPNQPQEIE
jgi:hypothetical protein